MEKSEAAEARLKKLAEAILAEEGLPTEDSDMALLQAFMTLGLEEPRLIREMNFQDIFDEYGILGWIFAIVFRRKGRQLLNRVNDRMNDTVKLHRDRWNRLIEETWLRERILGRVVYGASQLQKDAKDEARRIRDRAKRAANKTRNGTTKQLRDLLELARIRLLQQELEIAIQGEIEEEIPKLKAALVLALEDAHQKFGETSALVDELAKFDALMAGRKKPKRKRQ